MARRRICAVAVNFSREDERWQMLMFIAGD
jgi:hypothetical protein